MLYRHPVYKINQLELFTKSLEEVLIKINDTKSEMFLMGDFSIDISKTGTNETKKSYIDSLISYSIKCIINKPTTITTHSKTLLDHIYANSLKKHFVGGIVLCDISDHLPIFLTLKCCNVKRKSL